MDPSGHLPDRPGHGKEGRQIMVATNFFPVAKVPDSVYHYDVSITPEMKKPSPEFMYELFGLFLKANKGALGSNGNVPVFDGRANIYSSRKLPLGPKDVKEFTLELTGKTGRVQKFVFTLKLVAELNTSELMTFLTAAAGSSGAPPSFVAQHAAVVQGLEVGMYQQAAMTMLRIRQSFFIPTDPMRISGGAEVWKGMHASLRPGQGKLLLNVDMAITAFHQPRPVVAVVADALGKRDVDGLTSTLHGRDMEMALRALKNKQITLTHRGQSKRKYKITGMTETAANETMFEMEENGQPVSRSVAWYFDKQYGISLRKGFLNCLIVGNPEKKIYLPMEVCELAKGQRIPLQQINERQTSDIIKIACLKPHERRRRIDENFRALQTDNEYTRSMGLEIVPQMMEVPARILEAPTVNYRQSMRPQLGAWNLRGMKVQAGVTLQSWAVIDYANMDERAVSNFVRELVITCNDTGMNIVNKNPPCKRGDIRKIGRMLEACVQNVAGCQMILIILPTTDSSVYGEIKQISDCHIGIVTQCIQAKNVRDAKKQLCANVCLKMNAKLGGVNATLSKEVLPFITSSPTIVFGADVTHPSVGDQSSPSVCALVGSLDVNCVKFAGVLSVQPSRVEIISQLEKMVVSLLKRFYAATKFKPVKILFYRDGVSEGQFMQVRDHEIRAIQRACASLEKGYSPKITFVVVQKRHHARFFPTNRNDEDRSGNVAPGTVVDSQITHPREFDFYLMSHSGIQGTSRPCHYHVLLDQNAFTADALQKLTYNMCYTYARATRSVSVVPAAYYAHLLAFRSRFMGGVKTVNGPGGEMMMEFNTPVVKGLETVMYYM